MCGGFDDGGSSRQKLYSGIKIAENIERNTKFGAIAHDVEQKFYLTIFLLTRSASRHLFFRFFMKFVSIQKEKFIQILLNRRNVSIAAGGHRMNNIQFMEWEKYTFLQNLILEKKNLKMEF